tara:strand:+ start:365 stop:514 length:150 start_codon:yes stop_codon:yes gene_type:complete
MDLLLNNWEWILLVMYVVEKVVALSPTKRDDVVFDMILKPIFNAVKGRK